MDGWQAERNHTMELEQVLLPLRPSPLGYDRFCRRYWLFPNTRHVLVEPPTLAAFAAVGTIAPPASRTIA